MTRAPGSGQRAAENSDFFDLREIQLDTGGPAEDGDGHPHLALLVVDFLGRAVEVGERAFLDTDELADEVATFCAHLAGLAPLALLGMKRSLNRLAAGPLDAAAEAEIAAAIARAAASEDLQEGAAAWAAKRAPVFRGR